MLVLIKLIELTTSLHFDKAGICNHTKKPAKPAFWFKTKNQWHWFTKNCYFIYDLTKQQETCIRNQSIVLFGDSHFRHQFQAMSKYKFQHLAYRQVTTAMHVVARIQDWLEEYKNSSQRVDSIVISTGHHDLLHLGPIYYIAYFEEIFNLISLIQNLKDPPKVLWQEITPIEKDKFPAVTVNNRLIIAFNTWTGHKMQKLGVGIVPAFDMAWAMPGYTKDGLHHNYATKTNNATIGHIGGAMVAVLMSMLC